MKHFIPLSVLVLILSVVTGAGGFGQIPTMISHQGLLTDTSGMPLQGPYDLTFLLYTTPTGGTAIWSETHTGVAATNGTFNVALGTTAPLTGILFNQQLYLGFAVGADPEMSPRSRLTSVPSAFISNDVVDNAVTNEKIADAAVTTSKISANGAVGGQSLTFNGTDVVWGNPSAALALPYDDSTASPGAAFSVTNTRTSGAAWGVVGRSNSIIGLGLYGYAAATSGENYGVWGASNSPAGRGVYGVAPNYGVYGSAYSANGTTYGVYGASNSWAGVYGVSPAHGVYGVSTSNFGIGIRGEATATTGNTYGVYATSNSAFGRGMYAQAIMYGVQGVATGSIGTGVYGASSGSNGVGVFGSSSYRAGYFDGTLQYTGSLIGPSDVRFKENIQPVSSGQRGSPIKASRTSSSFPCLFRPSRTNRI